MNIVVQARSQRSYVDGCQEVYAGEVNGRPNHRPGTI